MNTKGDSGDTLLTGTWSIPGDEGCSRGMIGIKDEGPLSPGVQSLYPDSLDETSVVVRGIKAFHLDVTISG